MSIPRNRGPGELPEKPATGMPINKGLKNPKRYKRASWVGDGLNTVRDFEVLISLGARGYGTLKTHEGHFRVPLFGEFQAVFDPFLALRPMYILGLFKQLQTRGPWRMDDDCNGNAKLRVGGR
jgi:hypothetical protein